MGPRFMTRKILEDLGPQGHPERIGYGPTAGFSQHRLSRKERSSRNNPIPGRDASFSGRDRKDPAAAVDAGAQSADDLDVIIGAGG